MSMVLSVATLVTIWSGLTVSTRGSEMAIFLMQLSPHDAPVSSYWSALMGQLLWVSSAHTTPKIKQASRINQAPRRAGPCRAVPCRAAVPGARSDEG